ncbi:MAG: MFS transporter [Candidatus Bathyarchaeota archaeon]|nr:MFS transporter [Candidatus Bathyarchaeota archaeon]
MPKEATYLICAAILPSVAYGMFYTDISYFLTAVQGVSYELMGVAITLMGVSTFVASIFLGIAADVYGRKKMLIAGNILASLILAVFALTTDPTLLLVAAILEGVSEAAVLASSSALLADKAENEKRNSAFSMYGFVQSIAFGLGSIVIPGMAVFEVFGFTKKESHILLYVVIALFSLASTLIMLKVSESKRLKKHSTGITSLLPRKSKAVLSKYVFAGAIIAFGAGMVVPLMTAWFSLRYGVSDIISGPVLGISSILIGAGTLVAPPLAKRLGIVKAIVVTQTASMVFMFATPLAPDFALASFVYSIRALLMNMASPLQQSMIMGLVAEDERGAASGLSGALWRLPNALSTFIGAWLMGLGLLAEPFFVAGLFYIVSIALFWGFFRKTRMPEEQPR